MQLPHSGKAARSARRIFSGPNIFLHCWGSWDWFCFLKFPTLSSPICAPLTSAETSISIANDPVHMMTGQLLWLPLVLAFAMLFAAIFRRTIYAAVAMIVAVLALLLFPLGPQSIFSDALFTGYPSEAVLPVEAVTVILAGVLTVLARVAFDKQWRIG